MAVLVLVAFVLPGGERADPFEGPGAALDLTLKLGAVLALVYVSLAALKRYTGGAAQQARDAAGRAGLEDAGAESLGVRGPGGRQAAGTRRDAASITALAELDVEPEITATELPPGLEIDDDISFEAHLQRAEGDTAEDHIGAGAGANGRAGGESERARLKQGDEGLAR